MSNIDKQALREEFRFMQVHYSDPADRARQVIYIAAEALLDDLEIKEEQRANWFQMAQKLGEDLDAAEKRNAEQREYYEGVIADGSKRIAELEARAVNLPKRSVDEVMHLSGFSRDYAEGWCAGNDNAIHEIRAAGIKVKGA
ncbi:ead/Ea22-like family protein [Salmonella enterica subsp. enterica serovar Montevideo]|uniref:Ead/Ea22-like family protein n=2 Tax=Salmonella enterica TaxID=28901 RepID=A0A602T6Q4_SALMO|nr:ead/Ea22-like family protein [Salmonella enterica]EBP3753000.1 ead/Ea22-like family protein [Salmonella enterica subsp. enterica]EDB2126190.1 ead/Ea22-like family protein [Salmonella enterica subsp. enterica serovar Oranienburg]EDD0346941.1 ead/Ea22-like family protein [Salmonella enterica subsp. enterica serovar Enteritidis]EHG6091914.1 ead/Ea22-like family protein [Salmonella enterica subsp. enterica serovar Braenderup]QVC01430.1 ead/Ea22-like family protein [Salmonella enterica subsp. en